MWSSTSPHLALNLSSEEGKFHTLSSASLTVYRRNSKQMFYGMDMSNAVGGCRKALEVRLG